MKKKVIDYCACSHVETDSLNVQVRFLLKSNWQPLGGITAAAAKLPNGEHQIIYTQALVKYEEN